MKGGASAFRLSVLTSDARCASSTAAKTRMPTTKQCFSGSGAWQLVSGMHVAISQDEMMPPVSLLHDSCTVSGSEVCGGTTAPQGAPEPTPRSSRTEK